MIYDIKPTAKYRKDLKRAQRRGYDMELMRTVLKKLACGEILEEKYHDHPLSGNYNGCRECHITPDWLLIYQKLETELILVLTRTGTHSDLF